MTDLRETEAIGLFQGDIIIKTAIEQALVDLRSRPDDLALIWASLAQDALTLQRHGFGEVQIEEAKKWFMSADIPVVLNVRVPDNIRSGSFITISVQKSDEQMNTLGDSYWGSEDVDEGQPFFTPAFNVEDWDVTTGEITLPSGIQALFPVATGLIVLTRAGESFPIQAVNDDVITIDNAGRALDLRGIRVRYPTGGFVRQLEGMVARETYGIGCSAYHEPIHALLLSNVVIYALTKFREQYLEARGFQGSSASLGPMDFDPNFGAELGYSRFITLTGLVHQVWAKEPKPKAVAVTTRLRVIGGAHYPLEVDLESLDDLLWIGDQDGLGLSFGAVSTPAAAGSETPMKVYFGVGTQGLSTPGEIEGLLTAREQPTRQFTFTVVAGPNQFIFVAIPIELGEPSFQVGVFIGGFVTAVGSVTVDGRALKLFRSAQPSLGNTTVEVL